MGEFLDERLPIDIDYGSSFTESHSVTIHGTPDGQEYRRLLHPYMQLKYDLSYEKNFDDAVGLVLNMYHRANGSYRGFRVKNLADFSTNGYNQVPTPFDMLLLDRGLSDHSYQMVKYYGRTAWEGIADSKASRRIIRKPVANTTRCGLDSEQLEYQPLQFSVFTQTGIVQFSSATGFIAQPVLFVECGNPTVFRIPSPNNYFDVYGTALLSYFHEQAYSPNNALSGVTIAMDSASVTLPIDTTGQEAVLNIPAISVLLMKKFIRGDYVEINGDIYTFQSNKAQGIYTLPTNPANNETVTIGGTTYTFKTTLSVGPTIPNEVLRHASNSTVSLENLYLAITGGTGIGTRYSTGTVAHTQVDAAYDIAVGGTITLIAKTGGTGGNSIATTESSSGSFGSTTLTGGVASLTLAPYEVLVGATAADDRDNLIAAINADAGAGTIYGTGTLISDYVIADTVGGDNYMRITATPPNSGLYGNEFSVSFSVVSVSGYAGEIYTTFTGWSNSPYMAGGYAGLMYDWPTAGIQNDDGLVTFGCEFDIPCRFDTIPTNGFSEYDTIQTTGITILELLNP